MEEYKYADITKNIISCAMKVHLAQAINYLEAFNLEIGLLINFGNTKLEFRRLINTRNHQSPSVNL